MRILFYLLSLLLCVQTMLHCGGDGPKRKQEDASEEEASLPKRQYTQEESECILQLIKKQGEQRLKIQSLIAELQTGVEEIETKIISLQKGQQQNALEGSSSILSEADEESDASTVGPASPLLADSDAMEVFSQEKAALQELWLFRYNARSKQGFACYDGKFIRVWDLNTRRSAATITLPAEEDIFDLRVHPYKPECCIISMHNSIQVVSPTGCIWKAAGESGKDARVLYINPNNQQQLFSGHGDGVVRLWEIESGKCLKQFKMFEQDAENSIFSLCATQEDTLLAATYKGRVKLKTAALSVPSQSFSTSEESLLYAHPTDGNKIIVAGSDIKIRSIRGKNWPQQFKTASDVTAVCTAKQPSVCIIAGLKNGAIEVWQERSSREYALVGTFDNCHKGPIIALWYDEAQNQLISAGEEGLIKVWQLNKERTEAHIIDLCNK